MTSISRDELSDFKKKKKKRKKRSDRALQWTIEINPDPNKQAQETSLFITVLSQFVINVEFCNSCRILQ